MTMKVLDAIIPIATMKIDAIIVTLMSSFLFSSKNRPRNLCEPIGTPNDAMDIKITDKELTDDEMPMTSGVVIFDRIYHIR